jgi:hypothetical protein
VEGVPSSLRPGDQVRATCSVEVLREGLGTEFGNRLFASMIERFEGVSPWSWPGSWSSTSNGIRRSVPVSTSSRATGRRAVILLLRDLVGVTDRTKRPCWTIGAPVPCIQQLAAVTTSVATTVL